MDQFLSMVAYEWKLNWPKNMLWNQTFDENFLTLLTHFIIDIVWKFRRHKIQFRYDTRRKLCPSLKLVALMHTYDIYLRLPCCLRPLFSTWPGTSSCSSRIKILAVHVELIYLILKFRTIIVWRMMLATNMISMSVLFDMHFEYQN